MLVWLGNIVILCLLWAKSACEAAATGDVIPKSVATVTEHGHQEETLPPQASEVPQAAPPPAPPARTCKLGIWSLAYMGGTLDRCKERCSGDFNFVQNNPKDFKDLGRVPNSCLVGARNKVAAAPGLQGRTWFSTLLLFDEIYDFLMELGVLDTAAAAAKKQGNAGADVSGQTPNSGWANRLLQTGLSVHETKTNGCFGGLHTPTVNTALAGNFHPSVAVEMLRGLRGDHGCQTKARLFFTTGRPIQPHEHYASHGITSAHEWCPVPDILKNLLQFLTDPVVAATQLGHEDDLQMGEALFTDDGYFPHASGWRYRLPDGVETFFRFRKDQDGVGHAEWCMANRDVEVPEEFSLELAAERLTEAFGADHRVLKFSPEAQKLFKSYQAYFNILVAEARAAEDIGHGAQMGSCPWKLAMLSAALMLWDISWEQHDGLPQGSLQQGEIEIPESVVFRAFGLLEILESIVAILAKLSHGGTSAFSTVTSAEEAEQKKAAQAEAALDAEMKGQGPDKHWEPRAQFTGLWDTEFFRRLLQKAELVSGEYVVKSQKVYCVARRTDKLKSTLTLKDFRTLASAAPSALVRFDREADCLLFTLPAEPAPDFESCLLTYANISTAALRTCMTDTTKKKRRVS